MKIYDNNTSETIIEWSKRLRSKFGTEFRLYGSDDETLERWHEHLSNLLGYKFEIRENQYETLKNWSRMIGG